MADMTQEQTDENSQAVDSASSSEAAHVESATPPTGEKPEASSTHENKIPQSRFNEVIEERNASRQREIALEARLQNLESSRSQAGPKRESVADLEVKRLVAKLGMSEDAAKELVESQLNIANSLRRDQEVAQSRFQAEQWAKQKAKDDADYAAIEPELDRQFSSLKPEMQTFIASNADALEMFYGNVKSKHQSNKAKEAYSKGADEAYKNKAAKQAVSSVPGSSSSGGKTSLTRDSIRKMDVKEYMSRQSEINEALKSGLIK